MKYMAMYYCNITTE